MKVALTVGLLLASSAAAAGCFTHPDTGALHCSAAWECPAPTTWSPRTQICAIAEPPAPGPTCTGTDSGVYTPEPEWTYNLSRATGRPAMWTRIGPVVTVAGAVAVIPAGPGFVQLHLEPPIGTGFSSHFEAAGVMSTRTASADVVSVPETGYVRLYFEGDGPGVNATARYTYSYRIAECPAR